MTLLAIRAYLLLLSFEWSIARNDFGNVYRRVRDRAVRAKESGLPPLERSCHAVNLACAAYFKQVQCLQRSATLVCLLRDCGTRASLVIGAQHIPFNGHAWVEVEGEIVNEHRANLEKYVVLDRC
jgi:Transglutaminase-like superfamily